MRTYGDTWVSNTFNVLESFMYSFMFDFSSVSPYATYTTHLDVVVM